ncbi:uncharacterized protein P884DRAFT_211166 [Thermothelomyces heterothallicus CBS 202.75]|uniref:uncharacterized protein n=1 Tax=Thermothelomyces heterothallicus CBS 202.75 TaxID=1149848 RepID=UPI0037440BB8
METVRTMLGCVARRRARHKGYTELLDDEKTTPLYSYEDDVVPYPSHEAMSYYHLHDGAATPAATSFDNYSDNDEKGGNHRQDDTRTVEEVARDVAQLLFGAEWNDDALQTRISDTVGDRPWNRKMVECCLDAVIEYIERGRVGMGGAMCAALDKATDMADEEFAFPRRHPESLDGFIAIVSAGVLAELQGAWVLELLGFGEVQGKQELNDGTGEIAMLTSDKIVPSPVPKPNSFAAWWTKAYDAYIPAGSIYAFLQRMDMIEPRA